MVSVLFVSVVVVTVVSVEVTAEERGSTIRKDLPRSGLKSLTGWRRCDSSFRIRSDDYKRMPGNDGRCRSSIGSFITQFNDSAAILLRIRVRCRFGELIMMMRSSISAIEKRGRCRQE